MAGHPVRLSSSAARWLNEEIAYIAGRSPAAARRISDRLRAARRMLAEHPLAGAPGALPGTRRLIVGDYVLTFRIKGEAVEIAAIRHARQGDAYAPKDVAEDPLPDGS